MFGESVGSKLPDARFIEDAEKQHPEDDGLRERDFWKKDIRKLYGEDTPKGVRSKVEKGFR
jgi:hypothetical protein